MPIVDEDLRGQATEMPRRRSSCATLDTMCLVHEVAGRLLGNNKIDQGVVIAIALVELVWRDDWTCSGCQSGQRPDSSRASSMYMK